MENENRKKTVWTEEGRSDRYVPRRRNGIWYSVRRTAVSLIRIGNGERSSAVSVCLGSLGRACAGAMLAAGITFAAGAFAPGYAYAEAVAETQTAEPDQTEPRQQAEQSAEPVQKGQPEQTAESSRTEQQGLPTEPAQKGQPEQTEPSRTEQHAAEPVQTKQQTGVQVQEEQQPQTEEGAGTAQDGGQIQTEEAAGDEKGQARAEQTDDGQPPQEDEQSESGELTQNGEETQNGGELQTGEQLQTGGEAQTGEQTQTGGQTENAQEPQTGETDSDAPAAAVSSQEIPANHPVKRLGKILREAAESCVKKVSGFSELRDAVEKAADSVKNIEIYLQADIEACPMARIGVKNRTVTIFGEDHSIKNAGALFSVKEGGVLNLGTADYGKSLKITGMKRTADPIISVADGGSLNLYGGVTLSGNTVQGTGAAISLQRGASCVMHGGTIEDCISQSAGAAVMVDNSSFKMEGGIIQNCEVRSGAANFGGGAVCVNGGSFTMNGGTISNCHADVSESGFGLGGGVLVQGNEDGTRGSFIMTGGTIEKCSARYGGAVAVLDDTSISGGTIQDNEANTSDGAFRYGGSGGGIFQLGGRLTVSGGQIQHNKAAGKGGFNPYFGDLYSDGGGISIYGGTADLSGAVIANNTADHSGADVYISEGSVVTLPDAGKMKQTYEALGLEDSVRESKKGKGITGWFSDEADSRYIPSKDGTPLATESLSPVRPGSYVASYREVEKTKIVIKLSGQQKTGKYDGQNHTAGFDIAYTVNGSPADCLPRNAAVVLKTGLYAAVTGKDAGRYTLPEGSPVTEDFFDIGGWEGKGAYNFFDDYEVVYEVYGQPVLLIEKRRVELTSGDAEKYYDGIPLISGEYFMKEGSDGFVDGEVLSHGPVGSRTEVGSGRNTIRILFADGVNPDNYEIIRNEGMLTVKEKEPEEKEIDSGKGDPSYPAADNGAGEGKTISKREKPVSARPGTARAVSTGKAAPAESVRKDTAQPAVQTGDRSPLPLYAAMMLLSAACMALYGIRRKQ